MPRPSPNYTLCLYNHQYCLVIRQWSSEVKGMGEQQQVGVVTLATAGLQEELGQGLGAALEALMSHLCREACRRCQAALDSCHTLTRYLGKCMNQNSKTRLCLLEVLIECARHDCISFFSFLCSSFPFFLLTYAVMCVVSTAASISTNQAQTFCNVVKAGGRCNHSSNKPILAVWTQVPQKGSRPSTSTGLPAAWADQK